VEFYLKINQDVVSKQTMLRCYMKQGEVEKLMKKPYLKYQMELVYTIA